MADEDFRLDIHGGKYTLVINEDDNVKFDRYAEVWPAGLTVDNPTYWLAHEARALANRVKPAEERIVDLEQALVYIRNYMKDIAVQLDQCSCHHQGPCASCSAKEIEAVLEHRLRGTKHDKTSST